MKLLLIMKQILKTYIIYTVIIIFAQTCSKSRASKRVDRCVTDLSSWQHYARRTQYTRSLFLSFSFFLI